MKKGTAITLVVVAIIAIISIGALNLYIYNRRVADVEGMKNENIQLKERVAAGDRTIDGLKKDTTELKAIIRTKVGEQLATARQVDQLKQREKKYLNESNAVLRYSDNHMDSIYRARYPVPDSIRVVGSTSN